MSKLLEDETAVVTGAASGNGRGIARRFAEEGADVVIADLQAEPRKAGEPTHELIEDRTGSAARYVECDVTDRSDLRTAVAAAEDLGGLDIMVNNAGIAFEGKPVVDITRQEYDEQMEVNLTGVFYGCQESARTMQERGGGNIINVSSVAGFKGAANNSVYSMSKAGVRILTQSLAAELGAQGIRVNAIHPGVIETAFTTRDQDIVGGEQGEAFMEGMALDRFGTPEDVGDSAVYLASDLSSFVTGHSLTVDGGFSATF